MNRRSGAGAANTRLHLLTAMLVLVLSGCALHGPESMRASRLGYNQAVQASDQRELLLNLVRLRYLEAPEFLAVNGIATQMSFDAGAVIGGEFGESGPGDVNLVTPGVSVGYSESPTITFVPQRGQDFTRQLIAPMELDSIYLLTRYGWGLDRVLRVMVSEMNGFYNEISREGGKASDINRFGELARGLRRLESQRLIRVDALRRRETLSEPIPGDSISPEDFLNAVEQGYQLERQLEPAGYVITGESTHYVLAVDPGAWSRQDTTRTLGALGVPPGRAYYEIDPQGAPDGRGLQLVTRSVLGAMAYLSNAVRVPEAHGELTGTAVEGENEMGDLLDVRVSDDPVTGAYIAVEHRGHWFYIDDQDVESKRTFGLLTSLIRMSITAGGAQNVPVLTLPVSR